MSQAQKSPDPQLDARALLAALQSLKKGNFAIRLPEDGTGMAGKIYDVFNDVAEPPADRLRPQSYRSFTDQLTAAAWHDTDSTYVICERDNAIPPFAQEAMARRATATERLDAGHSPFLSCPQDLAAIIEAGVSPLRRSSPASG